MHDQCARCDMNGLRDTLRSLYVESNSPLGESRADVAHPLAFAALVEIGCLARVHARAHPTERMRAHMADEMEENVDRLYRGFHIDSRTTDRIREALSACGGGESLDDAHRRTEQILEGTQLEGRVKLARHSVSRAPPRPY